MTVLERPARRTWRWVGQSLPRPEDHDLVRGAAPFVADIAAPEALDAVFVRSQTAHGHLVAVRTEQAARVAGVAAVWSAAELPDLPGVPPAARSQQPAAMRRPALVRDRVRFVGEPVAVVVAAGRYAAEDAAELVEVDIDPLPAVVDARAAAEADAPQLFDGVSNVSSTRELGAPCTPAVEASPVVVETWVTNQRVSPMSLEARAILVIPEPNGGLTVWCSHQAPHRLRAALARSFGLDPATVRVAVPSVGGAFGAKSQVYAEYLVVAAAAMRLGRPVRWIEDRYEAFVAATHGRGQTTHLRLGLDRDGRFQALEARIWADVGAYPDTGDFIPQLSAWVMSGPYRIPQIHVLAHSVVTTTTPTASYRGAGRPEAAFALERLVDLTADRLGLDPARLRETNLLTADELPYRSPTGAVYDSARHHDALHAAMDALDYAGWRAEQQRRRTSGERRQVGIGLASWVERSGGLGGSTEYARVEVGADGTVTARIGTASQGQGHLAPFAQVVADGLGVSPDAIRVRLGDTAEVAEGTGAFASRSMQVGGNAAYLAAVALRERLREAAAQRLDAAVADVADADGVFTTTDGRSTSLAELAAAVPDLAEEQVFGPPQAFPFGAYAAVVEVDTRTGEVAVLRLVAVDDVGVVVNPMVVSGQTVGSIAQGLGQALYEGIVYDESGQPLTTTLLDYTVPTAAEMPDLRLVEMVTPNPNVPLGTKGAGESGCIGTPPALVNAVCDALRDYDTTGLTMPLTARKVWECLQRPTVGPTR
ncbi:MAG TPA: xanthine dehydrogenase family protein molybdopterin-binding subunit [Actinomycetes bacterium]|nr:xanthine dehydrogenase family protein molybdopterin-binding subunit [Actinomycetes bacterium]